MLGHFRRLSTNPYLAAAICLAAGIDRGIEHELAPGAPLNDDLYQRTRKELARAGIQLLPRTLLHALEAFEADPLSEQGVRTLQRYLPRPQTPRVGAKFLPGEPRTTQNLAHVHLSVPWRRGAARARLETAGGGDPGEKRTEA